MTNKKPYYTHEINAVFAQNVAEWDVVIDAAYTVDPSVLEGLSEGESAAERKKCAKIADEFRNHHTSTIQIRSQLQT